jgi:histidine ammonia-lyase
MLAVQSDLEQKNWRVCLYDGDGGFLKELFGIGQYDWRLCWDRKDPDILYTWKGSKLYRFRVATGQADVLSGGNFHGEPLAIAFDYLALGITELGNMSERRLARLLDGASNRRVLPDFLTRDGGLNSGFMLTQYTAAALASENKSLVHPASADTIPTSANWEDHVSNGPIAGRKARQIIENVERIIALELLAAAQGIDFRREACPGAVLGAGTQIAYHLVRSCVPFLDRDGVLYPHMNAIYELVAGGKLRDAVQPVIAGCWQA